MADWGRKIKVKCPQCKRRVMLIVGKVNRARKMGYEIFCSRECSSEARRFYKGIEQKKEEKRLYDLEYRTKNKAILKAKKARAFQERPQWRRDYEIEYRKKNMKRHVEYCRDPEYREWKKKYDAQYRAQQEVGEYWESLMLAISINNEVKSRISKEEIAIAKGYYNKSQQRRRDYERQNCV